MLVRPANSPGRRWGCILSATRYIFLGEGALGPIIRRVQKVPLGVGGAAPTSALTSLLREVQSRLNVKKCTTLSIRRLQRNCHLSQ